MKMLLLARMLFAAAAEAATASMTAVTAPREPKSENLTKLQAELAAKWSHMVAQTPGSKEALDANLDVYKQQKLIDGEIATIRKGWADEELAVKRNERVKLLDNYIELVITDRAIQADKKADIATKDAATKEANDAREVLVNQLLSKFAAAAPAKTAANGTTTTAGPKGAKTAEIRAAFDANRAAGMGDTDNVKAIIASGHSRGTTGAVVLAYQRELGEK